MPPTLQTRAQAGPRPRTPRCSVTRSSTAAGPRRRPLPGGDCHASPCNAWRNPAGCAHAPRGQEWHVDGGPHVPRAGDVGFFVSDVWHRRLPPSARARGRFFLQTNYARREIAQRVRPTSAVHHASPAAVARADTARKRTLIGLHPEAYYDG